MSWASGQRPKPDRWGESSGRSPRAFRGMDKPVTDRDKRFDEPMTVMGEFRRTKWQYKPTLENDEQRDIFVSELWARLKGQHT